MIEKDPTAIDVQLDVESHRISGVTGHGYIPFDCPAWSYIDKNLWQGGYVHGLQLSPAFEHIVSLYPWERYKDVHKNLKSYTVVEMFDAKDQGVEQVDALARWVNVCRETGPTLVHCQAGLNRSSLIVARALFLQGEDGDDIVDHLRATRSPACLCNPTFEAVVRSWTHVKRWINIGWSNSFSEWTEDADGRSSPSGPKEAVMNLNGRPRVYYTLNQAEKAKKHFSRDARTVELDFSEDGVSGKWVDTLKVEG